MDLNKFEESITIKLNRHDSESAKIKCAKEHFKAISDDVQMIQAKEFENFKDYY